jgi:hypothetical protein
LVARFQCRSSDVCSAPFHFAYFLSIDNGDTSARKTTMKARELEANNPSCLVRVKTSKASAKAISVAITEGNGDLFQKRLNQLVRTQMLRTKPRKARTGSQ